MRNEPDVRDGPRFLIVVGVCVILITFALWITAP